MSAFAPKIHQQQVLDSVEAYFKACHELPSPLYAFTATTERFVGSGQPVRPAVRFYSRHAVFLPAYIHQRRQEDPAGGQHAAPGDGLSTLVGLGRVGNLTVLEALWISFGNSASGLFATFQESDAATWT